MGVMEDLFGKPGPVKGGGCAPKVLVFVACATALLAALAYALGEYRVMF